MADAGKLLSCPLNVGKAVFSPSPESRSLNVFFSTMLTEVSLLFQKDHWARNQSKKSDACDNRNQPSSRRSRGPSMAKQPNSKMLVFTSDHFWVNWGCFFPFQSFKGILCMVSEYNLMSYLSLFLHFYPIFRQNSLSLCLLYSKCQFFS